MSTITYPRTRDCVNSLGIPVDNLSLRQATDRIIDMAKNRDGESRLVSTLNVDFLVNSLGYAFSRPRHPELLNVLRTSDMVTADGFPIILLSKIMGKPLQQRVTGSDLTPALALRAADEGLSLFLLGGGEGVAAAAAESLQEANPKLKIAGTCAPFIHTDGASLVDFAEDDAKVLQTINSSGADILFVGLGNPKQELWFNRNRHKLEVPVAIGVGGTFEFITGSVKRAPPWIQKLNLEWLFRITQDPQRLWRRYAVGLFKLGVLTAPLIYYRAKQELLYQVAVDNEPPRIRWNSVWSSRNQSLEVLQLPAVVTAAYLEELVASLQRAHANTALRLLDFSLVKHIHSSGQQEFFRLAQLLQDPQNDISMLGMSKTVKRQLAASRIMDVLGEDGNGDTLSTLSDSPQGNQQQTIGCKSYVMSETTLIFLSGRVSGDGLTALGFIECLQHATRNRTCILDLRNVTLLESTAIAELHPLIVAQQASRSGAILISGANANARQMFHMTGLGEQVLFIDDKTFLASIAAEGHDYK
ncbi:WecB/TagA/CpsF family glycosyltransferase [Halieaceae bacterium IMCC14734]|uniref:WecB/TagA/CpsF family glycosyltransferase n=1 Tax=Candidatus Litorirhabdus singularis TaxID=2518993 RepID=A0ABT3TE53_9GAMM|nr:WecB/TagA/CpsF family glycosyltransferase [Candidatus Litorirhabdus singularis]MCX2980591.1 WecB/TagA/CpsF family glycosyltransferase [Candidatus Litorirhabdus singularis]